MTAVIRFVTHVDLNDGATDARNLSVSARLEAVLADGRSVTLLNDRGWTSTPFVARTAEPPDVRAWTSVEDIEETSRMVVGPDEPFDGWTHEEAAAAHWAYLADILKGHGADVRAAELAQLPHDVALSDRLRAHVT
ncbi:hypothetical protein V1J52_18640 [Streptomyces sp. TRM 70351]|uniref:hypothetical protein n=1 Tax=Streptomyces sp. TRM 70351 TaxID=3116552 RepID=UPI002E7BF12E|nr:hypothetical protein [Streptomyces sp. TRM 70351]MEE1930179.1 hypothetical protein [Streptomyces sp. TRM 70351]